MYLQYRYSLISYIAYNYNARYDSLTSRMLIPVPPAEACDVTVQLLFTVTAG